MFYIFHRPEPRKFEYKPRYYDPEKEAWEKRKAALGADAQLSDREKLRLKMRSSWGTSDEDDKMKKPGTRYKRIRFLVYFVIIFLLMYFILATLLVENFVNMFFKLSAK